MRSKERMEPILAKIMRGWEVTPDLRLGQLLLSMTMLAGKNLYQIEDEELAELVYTGLRSTEKHANKRTY